MVEEASAGVKKSKTAGNTKRNSSDTEEDDYDEGNDLLTQYQNG